MKKLFLTLILSATILTGISPAEAKITDIVERALDVLNINRVVTAEEKDFFEFMKEVNVLLAGPDLSQYDSSDKHDVVLLLKDFKQMAGIVSGLDLSIVRDIQKLREQMELHRSGKYAQRVGELLQKHVIQNNLNVSSIQNFWNSLLGVKTAFAAPPSPTDIVSAGLGVIANSLISRSLDGIIEGLGIVRAGAGAVVENALGISPYPSEFMGIEALVQDLTQIFSDCPPETEWVYIGSKGHICCPNKRVITFGCCPEGTIAVKTQSTFDFYCMKPECAKQTFQEQGLEEWQEIDAWRYCPCGGKITRVDPKRNGNTVCCKNGYEFNQYTLTPYDVFHHSPEGAGDYTQENQRCCETANKVWSCDSKSGLFSTYSKCACCPKGKHYSLYDEKGDCCPEEQIFDGEKCVCPNGEPIMKNKETGKESCCKHDDKKCVCEAKGNEWHEDSKMCCEYGYAYVKNEETGEAFCCNPDDEKCICKAEGNEWREQTEGVGECCPAGWVWIDE